MTAKLQTRLFFTCALAVPFVFYAVTLCRGIYAGDSGELATAAALLQIAHPPGYPLLTNLGFLWTKLLIGFRPIIALNLFTALAMAASAGMLYRLLESLLKPTDWTKRLTLLAGVLVFAGSSTVWLYATAFEVYSLAALFNVLLLLLIVRSLASFELRGLVLLAFLFGLSLCNHLSSLALAPPVLYLLVRNRDRLTLKNLALIIAFVLIPLSLYFYLPIRSTQNLILDWSNPSNWQGFSDLVSAKEYRRFIAVPTIGDVPLYLMEVGQSIWSQHLLPLFLLSIPGLIIQIRRNLVLSLVLVSVVATNLTLNFFYLIPDLDPYFLPSWMILTVWLVECLCYLGELIRLRVAAIAIAIVVIVITGFNFQRCNLSDRVEGENYGRALLDEIPNQGVLFCGSDLTLFPTLYLRYVEHVRPDCQVYGYGMTLGRLKRDLGLADDMDFANSTALMKISMERIKSPLVIAREIVYTANNPSDFSTQLNQSDLLLCRDSCEFVRRNSIVDQADLRNVCDPMVAAVYLTDLLITSDSKSNEAGVSAGGALDQAERLVARFPRSLLFNSLADYLVTAGQYDRAYRVLKRGLDNSRLRRSAMMRILPLWASVNLEMGNSLEAQRAYREILESDPGHVVAKYSLLMIDGDFAARYGKLSEAASRYLEASQLMPDIDEVHFRLGQLYIKQGDPISARRSLGQCIRNGYRVAESQKLLEQLD